MFLPPSELILNNDGSIYHLNLLPEDIADTIITVGDPDRVKNITKHFDRVDVRKNNREFFTETGEVNGKRISVISTGIGTDNIDIVLNELDALVNINLETRTVNSELKKLKIIRIGTSGALHKDIEVDTFLISEMAIGFDSLLHYYQLNGPPQDTAEFSRALEQHLNLTAGLSTPYVVKGDEELINAFEDVSLLKGITATNVGFYGPQGRVLRLPLRDGELNEKISSFRFRDKRITNLEMETAGIYALCNLLGHQAISLNAILANRSSDTFSQNPLKAIDDLIVFALEKMTI